MTDEDKKEQKNVNPIGVAVTGAVVGAGIAVAGAVALQNKDNRKKVKQALGDIKDRAVDYMHNMQEKAEDKKEQLTDKFTGVEKKAKSSVKKVKKSAAKK